jgi:hypothetical protein
MVWFLFFSVFSSVHASEVQFEGYYRLELESKPIGYVIQRYEIDEKTKNMRSAYFLKTNALGGDVQESLKAESKTTKGKEFEPVSYAYTGQAGKTIKTIDATFRKERMEIVRGDGTNKVKKELYKIPADTVLSTFAGMMMLNKGIKVGKKFPYSAVAEEEGNSYAGESVVKNEEKFAGISVYRVENKFKGDNYISFVTATGETVGTIVKEKKLTLVLVSKPSDATQGLPFPNKSIILTFGDIPAGKVNALNRKPSSEEKEEKLEKKSSKDETGA